MIPQDSFTPHGYLDNPYHSWKLNPVGVLRSLQPLGMGWHVPNLGSYARNQFQYTAHLSIGLRVGDLVLLTPEDFARHDCTITSHLHTKNRFEYTCTIPQYSLTLKVRYFLINQDALGCVLSFSTTAIDPLALTCYLLHLHTHNPHTSRLWEHGVYVIAGPQEGTALLGIASEGDAFVHGARSADGTPLLFAEPETVVSLEEASDWAHGATVIPPSVVQGQPETGWLTRTVIMPYTVTLFDKGDTISEHIVNVVLARGVSQDQAFEHWADAIEEIARADADHESDDERFWGRAPQLAGAWPERWLRGLVYDLETLRMLMRPSAGVIPHIWDGMQIQAPRTVLAEAAMDTLFLSYADPELAAEVLLGHFESAPHPQLPCMREDGSYNMIADDGQICGTAPEWGYPVFCCDQLFRRTGNVQWLRRLYPYVSAYLRWWLEHRRDEDGWLVYACSWESGQDVSSRFGPQQTGGTIIQHVRPVDLQASMVQGAKILARWSSLLAAEPESIALPLPDFAAESAWWEAIADEFILKTRSMWQDGWFRDYDAVSHEWSTQLDAMHLAPVFCGASESKHVEQLRSFLVQPPTHSSAWAPLSWPPVVMTLVGAASAAQMSQHAAELAYRYIDAAYRSMDKRELDEHGGLPGITREYHQAITVGKWGEVEYVNSGIEGYGWGAISVHLLLRHIMGLYAEEANRITVQPALPHSLQQKGATYTVTNLPWGKYILHLDCIVKDAKGYRARLHCTIRPDAESLDDVATLEEAEKEYQYEWEGLWGQGCTLELPELKEVASPTPTQS